MPESYTQLMVGGVLTLLILEKVFTFIRPILLKNSKNGKPIHAGDMPVEFWLEQNRKIISDGLKPHVTALVEATERLEKVQTKINEGIIELVVLARQQAVRRPE